MWILLIAPVVAKYQELMASIVGGDQWFSGLDLANDLFVIPLHRDSYKFAFTFEGR